MRKFASEGYQVGLLARSADYIQTLAADLEASGTKALRTTQLTSAIPEWLKPVLTQSARNWGGVDVLINHAGNAAWVEFAELTAEAFHRSWQVCAFGSFLCAQQVVPDMVEKGSGCDSLHRSHISNPRQSGRDCLFQCEIRSPWVGMGIGAGDGASKGIHVAHIIIDGVIDTPRVHERYQLSEDEPLLLPDDIAEAYWSLVQQPKSAWAFELDLRPHNEEFFT